MDGRRVDDNFPRLVLGGNVHGCESLWTSLVTGSCGIHIDDALNKLKHQHSSPTRNTISRWPASSIRPTYCDLLVCNRGTIIVLGLVDMKDCRMKSLSLLCMYIVTG